MTRDVRTYPILTSIQPLVVTREFKKIKDRKSVRSKADN
jgi:hypothetical protein